MDGDVTLIRRRAVMTRALLRVADRFALDAAQLGAITGLSLAEIAAMRRGQLHLDPVDARWNVCVQLVQLHRRLDEVLAGDHAAVVGWMQTYNATLGGVPAELVRDEARMAAVIDHLKHVESRAGLL
jgi:hypothetical protein